MIENTDKDNGNLKFTFIIPPTSPLFTGNGEFNIKIWEGQLPSQCGNNSSLELFGTTVKLDTEQNDLPFHPDVKIEQAGSSSLQNGDGVIFEYIPIYDYSNFLLRYNPNYVPISEANITSFLSRENIRSERVGKWTSKFHARSISSAKWTITVYSRNSRYAKRVDFRRISDIYFYFDVIVGSGLSGSN